MTASEDGSSTAFEEAQKLIELMKANEKPSGKGVTFLEDQTNLSVNDDEEDDFSDRLSTSGETNVTTNTQRIKRSRSRLHHGIQLIASCQFAMIIIISRERIKLANTSNIAGEMFVVISILLITASGGNIETVFRGEEDITTKWDVLRFLLISVPVFTYLTVIEFWFMGLLFFVYDPLVHFPGLRENGIVVLDLARVLSSLKVGAVVVTFCVIPLAKLLKRRLRGDQERGAV